MKSQTKIPHRQVLGLGKACALLACLVIAMIGGCGGESDGDTEVPPPENFVFTAFNDSSYPITDVTIHGMKLPVKFLKVESKSSDTIAGKPMEIPKTVTVGWTDRRGDRNDYDVKLKGKIPKRFNGSMKFRIQNNGRVKFEAEAAP